MNIKLRSFESQILYFNGMYSLPLAPYPQVDAVVQWQKKQPDYADKGEGTKDLLLKRLSALKKILQDELNELDDLYRTLSTGGYPDEISFLVDMADLMGDLQVYCASELARFGIPNGEILKIIMDSNFSKLGADGLPIIKDGKVQKGPFYWKPEPQIKDMLQSRIDDHNQQASKE